MKLRNTLPLAAAVALLAAAAASAAGSPRGVVYSFRGHLRSASATSVAITVEGGDGSRCGSCSGSPSTRRSPPARRPSS